MMNKKGPIIVVDDDPDDQYLYQRTLEGFKLNNPILLFGKADEALSYLLKDDVEPFLILCDINMPGMTGLELREAMCNSDVLCHKNSPFIFMSTSARPADILKASQLYTHGFFQKETTLEKHERTLRMIVDYWCSCRYSQN